MLKHVHMDMTMNCVCDAGLCQDSVGYTRVETLLIVAGNASPEQFCGIRDDDRAESIAPITTRAVAALGRS